MSYSTGSSVDALEFSTLKENWGWTVAFGLLLSLAGAIALGSVTLTTISSVFFVGAAMIVSGVVEVAHWRSGRRTLEIPRGRIFEPNPTRTRIYRAARERLEDLYGRMTTGDGR